METTASPPPSPAARPAMPNAGVAIIAVILTAFAAWALREILEPFILAVFLLLVIDGSEKALVSRLKVPSWAALPLAILVVVALFALAIWMLATNATAMAHRSSFYAARLDALLQMFATRLHMAVAPTIDQLFRELNPGRYVSTIARGAGHIGENAILVLIYLIFMLAARRSFGRKLGKLFVETGRRDEALMIFDRIQRGVESYVAVQTFIGVVIAGLSALMIWPTGISNIPFLCLIIFIANYIPVFGVAVGVLLPPLFGLVELNNTWEPITLFVALELMHFIVSHLIAPRLQGQSLNIDPLVVLLALAFWGVIWGLTGAFLSTPLTVIVMAICAEFQAVRPIAILLSADGQPYSRER